MMKLGKRILVIVLALAMCLGVASLLVGCGDKKTVVKVFAHEGAYGKAFWTEIEKNYEKMKPGVDIQITALTTINESLNAALGAKQTYPDVVYLGTNQFSGYVKTNIIKEKADTLLMDLTEVLATKVPGEDKTLKEKIDPNFLNTAATSPFDDSKTYMLPLFYTVNGVFYNKDLLGTQAVPKTYAEMAAIKPAVSTAKVFGYPRGGYLDNMNIAAAKSTLSDADFNLWMKNGYSDTMYADSSAYKDYFTALDGLKPGFMDSFVASNVDNGDVISNTKAFYDGKVSFFVGGSMMPTDAKNWKIGEAAAIDKFDEEKVGFMAFPTVTSSQKQYFVSMIEQVYPIKTGNTEKEAIAKEFCAYLYSDAAATVMAKNNAMVPIVNRNDVATKAGMDTFTQSLFGVNGEPIFASLPTGTIPTDAAGKDTVWNLAFKQVLCFGINKVMGQPVGASDSAKAPTTGAGLFEEVRNWSKIFNKK